MTLTLTAGILLYALYRLTILIVPALWEKWGPLPPEKTELDYEREDREYYDRLYAARKR